MLAKLRSQLGLPGIIAIGALVFAMLGGAYAATGPNDGGKATASAKGKKGPRGKRGPKGATGAPGAQGPAGPAGAVGPAGANGANGEKGATGTAGKDGATGKDGTSVTNTSIASGLPQCDELGGAEFKVGSGTPTFACNGEEGEKGEKGSPWVPDNTLPDGATLTGTWSFNATKADGTVIGEGPEAYAPISFPIKLAAPLDESKVHAQGEADFATNCPGTAIAPSAAKGHLCVYRIPSNLIKATFAVPFGFGKPFLNQEASEFGADPAGTVLLFKITEDPASGFGSWAVTGF